MEGDGCKTVGSKISGQTCWQQMKWHIELYFTWGDSSIHSNCLAMMSIRPKRTHFCCKMLCFQQLTQLNWVIAVENTPTRASAFNLSDPAVVVNERAVTSRHRNEEYSSNPHPVSGSSVVAQNWIKETPLKIQFYLQEFQFHFLHWYRVFDCTEWRYSSRMQ